MKTRTFTRVATLVSAVVVATALLAPIAAQPAAAAPVSGESPDCEIDYATLYGELITLGAAAGGPIGAAIGALAAGLTDVILDEVGWTWVDPAHPMQTLNGVVEDGSHVSFTDLPITHDSHDANFWVRPDEGNDSPLLSVANIGDIIEGGPTHTGLMEVEWETNDYPEWARPNVGDRVWINGNWILDCGHDGPNTHRHFAEIHPPRAIATTRDQVKTLPGSGTTPVAVKATDLYIHGNGGFATTMLECGVSQVIILNQIGSCPSRPGIAEDFDFDIPLPPAPSPSAVLEATYETGPGNTLSPAPVITKHPETNPPTVHVHVPLAGSGASNSDVYARKIYSGWLVPPTNLHRYHASLTKGTMFEDMELAGGDCECDAFWMSVNRAEDEWTPLDGYDQITDSHPCSSFCFLDPCDSDFAAQFVDDKNTLDDWDDSHSCGDGTLNFTGPNYDFYLANNQDVRFQFAGYDSDCFDDVFGSPHSLEVNGIGMGICYLDLISDIGGDGPDNDDMGDVVGTFNASNVVGGHDIGNGNYRMHVNVTETPLALEDKADLAVTKGCTPTTVNAPGPFSCRIEVTNSGPGLPTRRSAHRHHHDRDPVDRVRHREPDAELGGRRGNATDAVQPEWRPDHVQHRISSPWPRQSRGHLLDDVERRWHDLRYCDRDHSVHRRQRLEQLRIGDCDGDPPSESERHEERFAEPRLGRWPAHLHGDHNQCRTVEREQRLAIRHPSRGHAVQVGDPERRRRLHTAACRWNGNSRVHMGGDDGRETAYEACRSQ